MSDVPREAVLIAATMTIGLMAGVFGATALRMNDSSVIHPQLWMNLWRSRFEGPERLRLDDFGALPEPGSDHPLTGEKSANNHDQARQHGGQPGVAQQSGHSGVCQQ